MKHFILLTAFILCFATTSLADDVYGCIINETPAPVEGTVSSGLHKEVFVVQGDYVWCKKLPEGRYVAKSKDGKFNETFNVSWKNDTVLVGDQNLHWIVKIEE
ncbi:MAG: hypothetical protein BA863_12425 [Desulfovibrio sp. S3730MH75]|nr:MAG: hypothetical protein BA863_12425 [Desulfovibrio sp. S3730MH75]